MSTKKKKRDDRRECVAETQELCGTFALKKEQKTLLKGSVFFNV